MSFDHLNNSLSQQSEHPAEQPSYQVESMYDKEKWVNPHDIAGQEGLVMAQAVELEKKKVQFRMANETYLRKHPELAAMMSIFLFRVLEEKPEDLLAYAGKFFDQEQLEEVIKIQKQHYLQTS